MREFCLRAHYEGDGRRETAADTREVRVMWDGVVIFWRVEWALFVCYWYAFLQGYILYV